MNVAFYVAAFDQASGAFMRNIGLGRHYVDGKHGMTFVLETHVTYDREMKGGALMRFTTQLLDRDAKRVHLFHEMYHRDAGCPGRDQRDDRDEHRLRDSAGQRRGLTSRRSSDWRRCGRRTSTCRSRPSRAG